MFIKIFVNALVSNNFNWEMCEKLTVKSDQKAYL